MSKTWIQTYTKRRFNVLEPKPEDIDIRDIAHALSCVPRFAGHTSEPYFVAQHSCLVAICCHKNNRLAGLLHDATDAYLCDIPRPIKYLPEMAPFLAIENNLLRVILVKYGLPPELPEEVHWADDTVLAMEARDLMSPTIDDWDKSLPPPVDFLPIIPLAPADAERLFLEAFELFSKAD